MSANTKRRLADHGDLLMDQVEAFRDLHKGEIARLKKELRIAKAEAESLRLVATSAYLAMRSIRGLSMTPQQRDGIRGATVATARAIGIQSAADGD